MSNHPGPFRLIAPYGEVTFQSDHDMAETLSNARTGMVAIDGLGAVIYPALSNATDQDDLDAVTLDLRDAFVRHGYTEGTALVLAAYATVTIAKVIEGVLA